MKPTDTCIQPFQIHESSILLLDQTALPERQEYINIDSLEKAESAIISLKIRGAPAIALFAAYVTYQTMQRIVAHAVNPDRSAFIRELIQVKDRLLQTRPTAVNLSHALNDMISVITKTADETPVSDLLGALKKKAIEIQEEDRILCENISRNGLPLYPEKAKVLTHCNTGSLATWGIGTALGSIKSAYQSGKIEIVYATETRPLLQGSRITAFELLKDNIPTCLITDSMVSSTIENKQIDLIVVGADRIARNGDTANKIGTLALAIQARYFQIPFYVFAPSTTLDPELASGSDIVIEERKAEEILKIRDIPIAPGNCPVYNPAFDITPAELISGIVTEKGVFKEPYNF